MGSFWENPECSSAEALSFVTSLLGLPFRVKVRGLKKPSPFFPSWVRTVEKNGTHLEGGCGPSLKPNPNHFPSLSALVTRLPTTVWLWPVLSIPGMAGGPSPTPQCPPSPWVRG